MNLFKNPHLKILALLSALILWIFVVGVENYVYTSSSDLQVKVINLGQNVSIANELSKVKVKYKSNGAGPINFNSNEIELFVDANDLTDGLHNLPIQVINKHSKIQIVAVEPASIDIKLEAITSRNIAIKVDISGSPHRSYELHSVKPQITNVAVSGAASAIDNLKELPLKVTLDGTETADFSRKIVLEPPSSWKLSGQSVKFDPATVQIDIEIRKKKTDLSDSTSVDNTVEGENSSQISNELTTNKNSIRKTLMAKIVLDDELRVAAREVLPQNILLTVEGKESDLAKVSNESIKLLIKNSDVQNGIYTVKTDDLIMPKDVTLTVTSFSPAKINIKF